MPTGAGPKETSAKPKETGARRKKKDHCIPSRYLQASGENSKSSTVSQDSLLSETVSQDTSISQKTSSPFSKEDFVLPQLNESSITATGGLHAVPPVKARLGPDPASSVKRNLSTKYKSLNATQQQPLPVIEEVMCKEKQDEDVLVSQDPSRSSKTPMLKEELAIPQIIVSSVTEADRSIKVPHLKAGLKPEPASFLKKNLKKSKSPDVIDGSLCTGKKKPEKFNEMELELMYAIYLQAVFIQGKAKETLEERSTIAKETLHKINSLVLQLLHRYRSQQLTLKVILSLIEIHDHCQKQESILRPIYDIIPELEEKYKIMSETVNIMKHRLHLKDAVPPPPGSERDILTALQKISEMIKDFMEPKYLELISSADLLKSYVDTGEILTGALKRGLSLLVEARETCISEASLALSDI